MLPTLEGSIGRLRRRVLVKAWAERVGVHVAVALFAVGAAVLVVRVGLRWERADVLPLVALALVAPLSAWWVARRQVPSHDRAAAWLDVTGGAAGRIVTENELGPSTWSDAARDQLARSIAALPRASWKQPLKSTALAAAFLAAALWIDPPKIEIGPPPAVADAAIERVADKLETLEDALELEPEVTAEMQAQLERIEDEADQGRPESTFEALDRLESELAERADDAALDAQHALSHLNDASANPDLSQAQAALQEALAKMGEAGLAKELTSEVTDALQPGTLALPKGMQLSSAELAKLSKALKGVMDERLAKLAQGRLLDPKQLRALGELGELASLDDFDFDHVCDEDCLKPGGT